jgi:hypothetical protein
MSLLALEVNNVKNDSSRVGGFAPSQWVLGRFPNRPGADRFDDDNWADFGILQSKLDPNTAFALQQELRVAARKAFVNVDCGKRVARSILRKSAPLIGKYAAGDLITFMKKVKSRDDI